MTKGTRDWNLNLSCLSNLTVIFSRWTWVSRYQNVSILDFTGAKDDADGSDNSPVKTSPPPNHNPSFAHAGCPSCYPTNSVRELKGT